MNFGHGVPLFCSTIIISAVLLRTLALDTPPQLECLENAMRLHFVPDPEPAFGGHVYLKGFFFTTHCHMDYTLQPIGQPFYFHVPYRSECQVKRERSIEGEGGRNISGVSYSTIVIVQHHRLFVTNRDKAYAVNCFYREAKRDLERKLEVGDLTPTDVSGIKEAPVCVYEVLREGQPVRYANVGDVLVHRWSCDTTDLGILVHSCTIRDGLGHSFSLLDQRGCVTDPSLLAPLTYTMQLNSSSTPISAFKFADQMVAYFSCQITLCDKRENGCEGITPPICEMIPLPSEGGPRMPVSEARDIPPAVRRDLISHLPQQNPPMPMAPKCCGWRGGVRDLQQRNGGRVMHFGRERFGDTRHRRRRTTTDRRTTAQSEMHFGNGTNRISPLTKGGSKSPKLITVDVMADRLLVFTTDEGPTQAERMKLISTANGSAEGTDQQRTQTTGTTTMATTECQPFSALLWPSILTASALLPLSLLALILQRHFLRRKIMALSTYSPSSSGVQFEMAGVVPSFGGQRAKYGRF